MSNAVLNALQFFRHMRVVSEMDKEMKNVELFDLRDLREGKQVTIAYMRSHVEADEFNEAFERVRSALARPDAEALAVAPELSGKKAVVLYFETEADRDEIVAAIQIAKPGMRAVNL